MRADPQLCPLHAEGWNCSVIGVPFPIGRKLLFKNLAFAFQAKPTYTLLTFTHTNLRHACPESNREPTLAALRRLGYDEYAL
jgi:hypothetical protein